MGNGITKNPCFSGDPYAAAVASDPLPDDSHGHSFTYVPSSAAAFDHSPRSAAASSETSFFSLSGAAISANPATSASMPSFRLYNELTWPPSTACTFESSRSFAAAPLIQAAPPRLSMSGPLHATSGRFSEASGSASTASDRFSDHPFMDGMLDRASSASSTARLMPSFSHLMSEPRVAQSGLSNERSLIRSLVRVASKLRFGVPLSGRRSNGPAEPTTKSDGDYRSTPKGNVEWAQGMAGEDRFHVAVSEEHGWVFVGIYDGFNGPDATDYLFANLYVAVHRELKGVLWDDIQGVDVVTDNLPDPALANATHLCFLDAGGVGGGGDDDPDAERKAKRGRIERNADDDGASSVHRDVLKALARALARTEEAFFAAAEERAAQSPELGLVGSCVLVMLMKGKDVYLMNVGDSRAVLARRREPDFKDIFFRPDQDLQLLKAEVIRELEAHDRNGLQCVQLTPEHSAAAEEEVRRIRSQHLTDRQAVVNGRVKGKLSVTRAFGAGYLKQPKWNDRLLEAFKVDYIGAEPYISCTPSLRHHRISSNDRFLVLSSDGLYQYFTNKEVVDQVAMFTAEQPDGDPAKHLVGELVLRAARKAGMDCRRLLEIPHGDRRNYHDDVSIIVMSFEGRIWRSSV
uniref:protein-serine/threonine phosphatase n=1 Tax=Oryza glumipatula TaxID=40148 RepID=A0A0D9Z5B3_9ORYZ